MGWYSEDLQRSYVCNHDLLTFFRKRKNWSQQQLADVSGLSARVICKGEAGDSIARNSVAKLAGALATPEQPVYPEDLISYPVDLCKKFVCALHEHQYRMTDFLSDLIEPETVFRIIGDPAKIPFAGRHRGCKGYRAALKKFFQILEYAPDFDHTKAYDYFPSGNDVVVWGKVELRLVDGGGKTESLTHRQRYRFRRGKLYAFEDHYSVEQGEQFVSEAVAILGEKVYDPTEDSRF